jgi:hypothetical protein
MQKLQDYPVTTITEKKNNPNAKRNSAPSKYSHHINVNGCNPKIKTRQCG